MIKPKSEVLYYPSIEFYDVSWLKGALCHWDKVYRIVPPSYTPRDSDEVKEAVDAGLIESINLTPGDLSDTTKKFKMFWDSSLFIPAGFEKDDEELIRLHPNKVDERIRSQLFALSHRIDQDGFQLLPRYIANSYMLFLSEAVSRRRLIPKITDNIDMFTALTYFQHDGNFDEAITNEDCEEITAALTLSSIIPSGIETYPMSKVIQFHQANREGREAFREAVAGLIDELKGIKDAEFFRKRITKFDEDLISSRKSITNALRINGLDFCYALVSVGLPMALSSLSIIALGTNPWSLQSLGGSAFLGVVAALADHARGRRQEWTSKEASYWFSLQSVFRSDKEARLKIPNFRYQFNEFIND